MLEVNPTPLSNHVIELRKPVECPPWMTPAQYDAVICSAVSAAVVVLDARISCSTLSGVSLVRSSICRNRR